MSETTPNPWAWIGEHKRLYQSDPEKAHLWESRLGGHDHGLVKTLLLTTTGRKSGKSISTPLIYAAVDGNFVVVGSKGGAPEDPAWALNLAAHPACEIQVGRDHYVCTARVAAGAERAKLWAEALKVWPPYDDYQKRTGGREIPVIVLAPKRG